MDKLYVADTNVLLEKPEIISDYKVVILGHVIRELEKHKLNKNPELAYNARKATRYIDSNLDSLVFDTKDYIVEFDPDADSNYTDNKIIQACLDNGYGLISNDLLLKIKAKVFDIEIKEIDHINKDTAYTGYTTIKLSEGDMAHLYENLHTNHYNLLTNEYLIVQNLYGTTVDRLRWDGKEYTKLKLPKSSRKNTIKPKNDEQAFALDLLYRKDVPIKFICGTYGSGKTFLTVKASLQLVQDEGAHSKIMVVRNPIGSGESIGWLKGTKEDKTQDFFKPFVQHLQGGEQEATVLESNGTLIKEIPYYIKGLSIDDTYVVVDEAEDLDLKLLKLIGTRLGENSAVAFCGDFKQAESKYIHNNGLRQAIEALKGHPLVGIVVMQEDVRSEASKAFAELENF